MPTGQVTFFHDWKGYGFIKTDEMEDDVFFHVDDIEGPEPREGDTVAFEIEEAPKGPRAANIEFA